MKRLIVALLALVTFSLNAQVTKIDLVKLAKPSGTNSQFLVTNGSGAVAWANAATLLTAGTGISISGNTITNSAPDQTVAITGSTGVAVTGTYPNFSVSVTDQSTTNEIQTLSAADGSGSDKQINLSLSGGTVVLSPGSGIAIARSGNTLTLSTTAAAPTLSISRYEEVVASGTSTITVSGFTPTTTDTMVFVDGVQMDIGTGEDATLSGSTYTFSQALNVGQKVIVKKFVVN